MEKILVEISARHVHVTDSDLAVLFGEGYKLTPKKELSQPGQFASEERVDVIGPKKELKGVSILGPTRKSTQVEISLSDARTIGVEAPVRESGDTAGSAGCKLVGPCGEITIEEGVIAAKRHIHLTPEAAAKLEVSDKQIVSAKIETPSRSLIFGDVVVRVSEKFSSAMHVDTDEGNAAGIARSAECEIIR
ncbi:MAG: phosphate propanoyltransferase [Oscillospiraceae bacterium]